MRIIIYGLNYAPELIGIGKYNTELAMWLSQKGHEVQVICAPPYYPSWRLKQGYSAWRYSLDRSQAVPVMRCPIWIPKSPGGLKRVLHLISFAISSWPMLLWYALRWQPDIIFTVEPPFFCFPGTLLISKLFKRKVWLHVQDFELDAGFNLGLVPSFEILRTFIFTCERLLLQQSTMVSTISEEMLKFLRCKGVAPEQSILFPNWVDTQKIAPLEDISPFRAKLGVDKAQTVCFYSGNLGTKQGLEIVISAARLLQPFPDIVFVIAGDGPMRQSLMEQSKDLDSVHFLPIQPQNQLNDLLNLADIHLLPQMEQSSELFFPSKLKAMFASGRPVIAITHPETQLGQVVTGRGIVSPPGNSAHLSHAIKLLGQDLELCQRFGQAARSYAIDHWGQSSTLSRIEEHFKDLMGPIHQDSIDRVTQQNSYPNQ